MSAPLPSWEYLGLDTPEKIQAYKDAIHKSTRDGLVEATRQNYVNAWNRQPWWWRKLHWKMNPRRNDADTRQGESIRWPSA